MLAITCNYRDDLFATCAGLALVVIVNVISWVAFFALFTLDPWTRVLFISVIQLVLIFLVFYVGKVLKKAVFSWKILSIDAAAKKLSLIVGGKRGAVSSKLERDLDTVKEICTKEVVETGLSIKRTELAIVFLGGEAIGLKISNHRKIGEIVTCMEQFSSKHSLGLRFNKEKNEKKGNIF